MIFLHHQVLITKIFALKLTVMLKSVAIPQGGYDFLASVGSFNRKTNGQVRYLVQVQLP